ncbi:MAG: hypothetical protein R8M11_07075 [Gallionella sp.]
MNSRLTISIVLLLALSANVSNAASLDPNTSVISTSLRNYFVMDALVPQRMKYRMESAFPQHGISGVYLSSWVATVNDRPLMDRLSKTCSGYDEVICYSLGDFYKPSADQLILTGFYKIDSNKILSYGVNSGFSSQKLSVTPAILIGGATRFYTSKDKDSHLIIEGNYWFGSKVDHKPCFDSFDRAYFCGNLTAWSDFDYDHSPDSFNVKIWYAKIF